MAAVVPGAIPGPTPFPSAGSSLFVPDAVPCYLRPKASLCKEVDRLTHNEWLAQSSDWLIAKPARVIAICVIAALLRKILHRTIDRICRQAANAGMPGLLHRGFMARQETAAASARRQQRTATLASVLQSLATGVIYSIALLMVLAELDLNIGPLLASAGIIGVAVGFGSQTLVKDFLSGVFMILEDQYGVGDQVDMGTATGVVESVGLRVTQVRDIEGTVWYVRNGDIARVGNKSQGWARVVIDVEVAHGEDITRIRQGLTSAGRGLMAGPHRGKLLESPIVMGVQDLKPDGMVLRVVVRTQPDARFVVSRAFRELIATSLKTEEIAVGSSNQTLWVRADGSLGERSITVSHEEQLRAQGESPSAAQ